MEPDDRHEDEGGSAADANEAAQERRRIRASTIVFAAATMLSRLAGLVREIATSAVFGTSAVYSAFVVANQIPNLIRSLVADSALGASFVPVYADLDERGERERAWRVAGAVCTGIVLLLGPLVVLAMVVTPWIVTPFVDDTFTAAQVQLTIDIARLLMPIVLILALSGITVGILNTHGRFGAAALAPVAWNAVILVSLVVAYWVTQSDTVRIWIYAAGVLAGTVVQVVMPLPHLRGLGGRLRFNRALRDPKVREVFVKMLPITLGIGLINLQLLISALLAANVDANVGPGFSGLDDGAGPAILDRAFRVYMLPQGIFSVAVTAVAFPAMSRLVARGDRRGFGESVSLGLRQILMLLVPSSVFIMAFAEPITRVLYQRGAFDEAQTDAVAITLAALAAGLVFNGLSLLLIRSFFALRRTWIPTVVSLATLAVNVAVALATYDTWGVAGIAAATAIANVLGTVAYYLLLRRHAVALGTRRTALVALGTLTSSIVAVGLPFAAWRMFVEPTVGDGFLPAVALLAAASAISVPTYLWLGVRLRAVRPGLLRDLRGRGSQTP